MEGSLIRPELRQAAFAAAVSLSLLIAPKVPAQTIVPAQVTTGATAEVERVIVTGSNIPTAAETGLIQWIRIVRQTLKNWAFAMQRT